MTFPNHPDKLSGTPILDPKEMIAYRRRLGRLPAIGQPEAALLCLQRELPRHMRWRVPIHRAGRLMGDVYVVKRHRGRVVVLDNFGIGAPAIAGLAEELIALGVRRMVSIVWGGGMSPDLRPGDIVVCDRAIRDEGVSHHYLPPGDSIPAGASTLAALTSALESLGHPVTVGGTWTTDAPYREMREEVLRYQAEGVKTVEMEIAALYAVARFRGVEAASAVVVGDSVANGVWQTADDLQPIERAFEKLYSAAVEALAEVR